MNKIKLNDTVILKGGNGYKMRVVDIDTSGNVLCKDAEDIFSDKIFGHFPVDNLTKV